MTDTMTSQKFELASWDTLYIITYLRSATENVVGHDLVVLNKRKLVHDRDVPWVESRLPSRTK
jgi:hypothetical protein